MPESREYPSRPIVGVGVVVLKEECAIIIGVGPPRLGGGFPEVLVIETVKKQPNRSILNRPECYPGPRIGEVVDRRSRRRGIALNFIITLSILGD